MTRLLANDVFGAIHAIGIVLLVTMIWKSRLRGAFERRCVGEATAIDLAWIRILACAVLLVYMTTEDLGSLSRLDAAWFEWPGYLIHLKRGALRFFLESEPHLRLLAGALLVSLVLGLFGVATRVTIPIAALLYVVYAALLRSFGKYFHDGYLVMYVMFVLCFVPCGDAWSFDAWWRNRRRPGKQPPAPRTAAYNWAVWACFAALCIPYLQLATSKLANGGLFWFDGRSLRNYMITDDLNLTEWDIDLALRAYKIPTTFWWIAGFFALAGEALYPFVLISRRLRRFVPYCVAMLHVGVWFGQDALFVDAILMPLAFLQPSRWFWRPVAAAEPPPAAPWWRRWRAGVRGPVVALVLVATMLVIDYSTYKVAFKYKWPMEGWQMYAGKMNLNPQVNYRRFVAHYADGRIAPAVLGDCAAFLDKPYRLDFGLIHDLPGFMTLCLSRKAGATALIYETRTWNYRVRTLDEHDQDPPDTAYRVSLVPPPPPELRAKQQVAPLIQVPDFEMVDKATGLPLSWFPLAGSFTGIGVDLASGNHTAFLAEVPRGPRSSPEPVTQRIRQELAVPAASDPRTLTVSVLARTRAAGTAIILELGGTTTTVTGSAAPADGAWHRIEASIPVPAGESKVMISLAAIGDSYFDDAAAELVPATGH